MHDSSILIFNDGKYDKYNVSIKLDDNSNIFNCNLEDCFDVNIKIYNEKVKYRDIKEVLKEE